MCVRAGPPMVTVALEERLVDELHDVVAALGIDGPPPLEPLDRGVPADQNGRNGHNRKEQQAGEAGGAATSHTGSLSGPRSVHSRRVEPATTVP